MKAILTDTTLCIGCNECVAACKKANKLPPDLPRRWYKPDGLSARNWTSVIRRPGGKYVRKQCRHCLEPACEAVCPVGALEHTPEGPVVYHADKCIGCRYCMLACPYGVPRYDWDRAAPFIEKCTFCTTREDKPGVPACTEVCPTKATIFGERDDLLAEAKKRLKANPKLKLYGDSDEIGGTCVLYVSDIDLSFLSYGKELASRPLPDTIHAPIQSTPYVFLGVGAVLLGVHWIVGRRMKLQEMHLHDEGEDAPSKQADAEQEVEAKEQEQTTEPSAEGEASPSDDQKGDSTTEAGRHE